MSARLWVVRVGQYGVPYRYVGKDGKDSAKTLQQAHVFTHLGEARAEANLWTNGHVERRALGKHAKRILASVRDGLPLDLRVVWMSVIELHGAGLLELANQPNGQLLIRGLTMAGRELLEESGRVRG